MLVCGVVGRELTVNQVADGLVEVVHAAVGSAIALFLYRLLTQTEEAFEERDKKIDRLISRSAAFRSPMSRGVDRTVVPSESEQLLPMSSAL